MDVKVTNSGLNQARKISEPRLWPHWVVGLVLLLVVALLLGGATVLGQRLRPKVGLQPTAIAHAQERTKYGFILSRPSRQPSSYDTEPLPTPSPEAGPNVIDVDTALLDEVEAAYSRFWVVRTEAALNLDVSRLPEVLDGPALDREQQQINDLQARGVAAVIEGDHDVGLLTLSQDEAELYDKYVNRSYLIDPITREPVGAPESEGTVKVSFRLRKFEGAWKVVDSERHE